MVVGRVEKGTPLRGVGGHRRHHELPDRLFIAPPRCRQDPPSIDRGILLVDAGWKRKGKEQGILGHGCMRERQGHVG